MKYSSRILSLLALVSMTVFFAGCDKGEDNKTSAKDQQIEKLVGTWNATSVTLDGDDQPDYDNFSITLSGDKGDDALAYDVEGLPTGKKISWNASGELEFGSPVTSAFIRSGDGLDITYTLSGNTLTLEFTLPEGGGFNGRTNEIDGQWVFILQK